MGNILKPKQQSVTPSVMREPKQPKAREVPKATVIPTEDIATTEANRRKEMMRSQQRGGLASTTLAEDKLG